MARVVRTFFAFLVLAVFATACADPGEEVPGAVASMPLNPFPDAATVQLYIDTSGRSSLRDAIAAGPVATLNDAQRAELEASFSIIPPDGVGEDISCFLPHHFFRYSDANGAHIGDIAVCFSCGGNSVTPEPEMPDGSWIYEDIDRIEALVAGMGHQTEIEH